MFFQCIYIRQVPWEALKTEAGGLGFQHLPGDLASVDACKTMFDPYILWPRMLNRFFVFFFVVVFFCLFVCLFFFVCFFLGLFVVFFVFFFNKT